MGAANNYTKLQPNFHISSHCNQYLFYYWLALTNDFVASSAYYKIQLWSALKYNKCLNISNRTIMRR